MLKTIAIIFAILVVLFEIGLFICLFVALDKLSFLRANKGRKSSDTFYLDDD